MSFGVLSTVSTLAFCSGLRLEREVAHSELSWRGLSAESAQLGEQLEGAAKYLESLAPLPLSPVPKGPSYPYNASASTPAFLRSLRPCAHCSKIRRYGERYDGGYVMCESQLQDQRKSWPELVGIYSYGIRGFDGWGQQLSSEFGIPIHQYDCDPMPANESVFCNVGRYKCKQFFHQECLVGLDDPTTGHFRVNIQGPKGTFLDHFAKNRHLDVEDGSLLAKVDIEGHEWSIFAKEDPDTLKKFRQISVEFHLLNFADYHYLYLEAMNRLFEAGFMVAHIHPTNAGKHFMIHYGEYQVPRAAEVTLIQRVPGESKACVSQAIYTKQDHSSNPLNEEMPDPVLPDYVTPAPVEGLPPQRVSTVVMEKPSGWRGPSSSGGGQLRPTTRVLPPSRAGVQPSGPRRYLTDQARQQQH